MNSIEALNKADLAGALACYSDKARFYKTGLPPKGIEVAYGRQQIRKALAAEIANHARWEVKIDAIRGDVVETRSRTWHDHTRQIGAAPLEVRGIYLIKDGKIDMFAAILSEASAMRLKKNALARTLPPAPSLGQEDRLAAGLTVTIADGTCNSEGPLALRAAELPLTIEVRDQDIEHFTFTIYALEPDKDIIDLLVSTERPQPPPWATLIWSKEIEPGQKERHNIQLPPGRLYVVCWIAAPKIAIGSIGPISVRE